MTDTPDEFDVKVRAAAFGVDADDVFGPRVHEAERPVAEPVKRLRQTEVRPLSEIQAELRAETSDRGQGKFRRRRV